MTATNSIRAVVARVASVWKGWLAAAGLVAVCGVLVADFLTTSRVLHVSQSTVHPKKGVVRIRYAYRAPRESWQIPEGLHVEFRYPQDKIEEIWLKDPTGFNKSFKLTRKERGRTYRLLGLFSPPNALTIGTIVDKVTLERMVPAPGSKPAPETMRNQIVVRFSSPIHHDFPEGENIPVSKMTYVELEPAVKGYYRFSDPRTLTFNFSEDRPTFETTYKVALFPDRFIRAEDQVWADTETSFAFTTSANEVYVTRFSIEKQASWDETLEIEFSGSMAKAVDVLKHKSQKEVPIRIEPKTPGQWVWTNARTLQFRPDLTKGGWPIRKHVSVHVESKINTEVGRAWRPQDHGDTWRFYVPPIPQRMSSVSPSRKGVELDTDVVVRFSRPMVSGARVRRTFRQGASGSVDPLLFVPSVSGKFVWVRPDTLRFRPDGMLGELTTYTVTLNPKYDPNTRYAWEGRREFSFSTVENVLRFSAYAVPEEGLDPTIFHRNRQLYAKLNEVPPEFRLWIEFDRDAATYWAKKKDLRRALNIQPPVGGRLRWLGRRLLEFVPDNNWPENTTLTIGPTGELLWHKEQHFQKDKETFSLTTTKNEVRVRLDGNLERFLPDQDIVVHFSKNMQTMLTVGESYQTSKLPDTAAPVTIEPPLDAQLTWKTPRELRIEPADYMKPMTSYKLSFNAGILPQKETTFVTGVNTSLTTTKNEVKIEQFTPQGLVRPRVTLDARFSKRVKPNDVAVGAKDNSGLFRIEPPIRGAWVWLAPDKLQFKAEEDLLPATDYAAVFDPSLIPSQDLSWDGPLGEDGQPNRVTYRFGRPPLTVKSAEARQVVNEEDPLKQRLYVDFAFSEPVLEEQLKAKFNFWYQRTDAGSAVDVPITYKLDLKKSNPEQEGYDQVSVVSDWLERPARDRRIFYRIFQGLSPVVGNRSLKATYQSHFLQEKPKKIVMPRFRWVLKNRIYEAELALSAPVEPERMEQSVQVIEVEKKRRVKGVHVSIASSGATRGQYGYRLSGPFVPQKKYAIVLPEGLLATDGAFMASELRKESQVPNLPGELDFAVSGNVLVKSQLSKVPIVTTNRNAFSLSIHQIYPNNIAHFLNQPTSASLPRLAKRVFYGSVETSKKQNRPTITHVDLSKLFDANVYGMYHVCVGAIGCEKSRWFASTDLGLVARNFGNTMVVWVRSLSNGNPIDGAQLSLVDVWNQTIVRAQTDAQGMARISYPEGRVPTLVLAKRGRDFSFLSMSLHRDSLKNFDTEGVSSQGASLRSFMYSDRGVYRPGEPVHLVAVTRAQKGRMPDDFPLEFLIRSPKGTDVVKERFRTGKDGVFVYNFKVEPEAKTGRYKAVVLWQDKVIGSYPFQVEEFVPAKIRVALKSERPHWNAGETMKFSVTGTHLFGASAVGNQVSAKVKLRAEYFKPKGFAGYWFGHEDTKFHRIDKDLGVKQLDENGTANFSYALPADVDSPIGLRAHYAAEVLDDGGRAVAAYGEVDVLLYDRFVGIKRLGSSDGEVGRPIRFSVVNVMASGERVPRAEQKLELSMFLERQVTHYRKDERGYYRYVTEKELQAIDLQDQGIDDQGRFSFSPKRGGQYVLKIRDGAGGQSTRKRFYVRGFEPDPLRGQAPDRVQMRLLGGRAKAGQAVRIEIRAPFGGALMLLGEQSELVYARTMSVGVRPTVVEIPVTSAHAPNFYLSATLIRPIDGLPEGQAAYATGLLNVAVVDPQQNPSFEIDVPERVGQGGELEVRLRLPEALGDDVHYTVAVIDEGILSLTGFETPKIGQFFHQKQRLEVEHYAMYGMVVPFIPDAEREISPSGDAPSRALIKKRRVNPLATERHRSVALWSGLLAVNENGHGRASFKLPDYDGELRVMAVAFGRDRFSSAEAKVIVRDKLVLKPSLPRFAAGGDEFVVPFTVFNGTQETGPVNIELKVSEHLLVEGPSRRVVSLGPGKKASGSFLLVAEATKELARVELVAEGLGERSTKQYKIPLRPAGRLQVRAGAGTVEPRSPVTVRFPEDFLEGSVDVALKVSSDPLVRFQNGMQYLVRYPHGCLEQTVSKAFPLIHYGAMADSLRGKGRSRRMVRAAIAKVQQMQAEGGAFYYWSGNSERNVWASIYATHFLVESKRANFRVSEATWNTMMGFLDRVVSRELNDVAENAQALSQMIYALYVQALAGRDVMSKLNYLYDELGEDLKNHERARLASAYAALGQKNRARSMLDSVDSYSVFDEPYRNTGGNFGSHIRDLATTLDAMVEGGLSAESASPLANQLIRGARGGRWSTTQENAFALLALGKLFQSKKQPRPTGSVRLGDQPLVKVGATRLFRTEELKDRVARIEASGKGQLSYSWQMVGLLQNPDSLQQDKGLEVRRRWRTGKGKPVDLAQVRQGQLLVAEVRIRSLRGRVSNVVISDLLPAGFEVENQRLKTSTNLSWLENQIKPDNMDIRDDRVNMYTTVRAKQDTIYYSVRAVTAGRFSAPGIRAEAMYDPAIYSEAGGGQVRVRGAE